MKRASDYLRELPDQAVADRYRGAVQELASVPALTDTFETAATVAIYHCERARITTRKPVLAHDLDPRSWNAVNTSARKLKAALARIKGYAWIRLALASQSSNMSLSTRQTFQFSKILDALANQRAKSLGQTTYVIGPIRVAKPSRKRMTLESALTICLAHTFERLKHQDFMLRPGSTIDKGTAWDVAADFTQAALGTYYDAGPAKKAFSENRGQLIFKGWPKSYDSAQK
jgi:hypothetical protein